MEHVPVRYLHWVWHNCDKSPKNEMVFEYIEENLSVLKDEDKDLIWK